MNYDFEMKQTQKDLKNCLGLDISEKEVFLTVFNLNRQIKKNGTLDKFESEIRNCISSKLYNRILGNSE